MIDGINNIQFIYKFHLGINNGVMSTRLLGDGVMSSWSKEQFTNSSLLETVWCEIDSFKKLKKKIDSFKKLKWHLFKVSRSASVQELDLSNITINWFLFCKVILITTQEAPQDDCHE